MMVLGPVAGGFVVAQFGAEAVLALDALSFAASFWLLRDVPSVIEVNDKEGISKNEKTGLHLVILARSTWQLVSY